MNQSVLITGCSSGIGRAAALHLQQAGWHVYATARDVASLEPLARAGCTVLPIDVTREDTMAAAVDAVERAHGSVGALVNNAGYSQSGAIEAVPLDRVRAQFETNVFGPARLTQLVLPGMRRARAGRIINLSSMGGRFVLPGGGYYHATKYAIEAISDALRFEVRRFGIDGVVIEPGLIRTSFSEAAVSAMRRPEASDPYARFEAEVARITSESYVKGSLARFASSPEDVAAVIERAVTDPRPRTRYVVSPSAHLLLALRAMLPDRLWDRFLARTYPQPGR